MTQEEKDLLTIREYYIIYAKATGKPYIDINNACYLFEIASEAKTFCEALQNTYVTNSQQLNEGIFGSDFYGYGIDLIHVKEKKRDEFTDVKLDKGCAKIRKHYNRLCVRDIYRLKQTGMKKYLRRFKKHTFLTPVKIDERLLKQYPKIHYSYATTNGEDKYYLLFSTIQEFSKWNDDNGKIWMPLEVTLNTFGNIRKSSPVLINPGSDKLILTEKHIKIALEEEKEKQSE